MHDRVTIEPGYRAGALGRIAELHGAYYHEHWGFGLFFEAKVATELAAFLQQFDPARDGFWLARSGARITGAIAIVGAEHPVARLRWFIVDPAAQGQGLGDQLLRTALHFCDQVGFERIYLTTVAGLDAARRLYERYGFRLQHEAEDSTWGRTMTEQVFVWERS